MLKDWLVPLAVAALAFGGLYALAPGPASEPHDDADETASLLYAFPGGALVTQGHAQVVAIDRDHAHPVAGDWRSAHVAILDTTPMPDGCDCVGPTWHVRLAADRHAGFGVAGFNGSALTIHVFDAAGELVASNGNASEQARLTGKFGPEQLPYGTWYFGANASAPSGTDPLPLAARALLPQLRSLLQGLPEGGVASTESDALATLYGRLYITVHVDRLVHAP